MKNVNLVKTILLIVSAFLLISCNDDNFDDDVIYDYAGISIYLKIRDTDGNDLLNPKHPNNLVESDIKFLHNQDTISVIWDADKPITKSRMYLAFFRCAIYKEIVTRDNIESYFHKTGEWVISLEDFPSIEDYEDEVIININDKRYTLKITNKSYFEKHTLYTDTHFYLDGVEQKGGYVTIIY